MSLRPQSICHLVTIRFSHSLFYLSGKGGRAEQRTYLLQVALASGDVDSIVSAGHAERDPGGGAGPPTGETRRRCRRTSRHRLPRRDSLVLRRVEDDGTSSPPWLASPPSDTGGTQHLTQLPRPCARRSPASSTEPRAPSNRCTRAPASRPAALIWCRRGGAASLVGCGQSGE